MDELRAALRTALAELADAELACREAERASWPYRPCRSYRRRADAAMSCWRKANLAVFDAQVELIFAGRAEEALRA